jgi:hypothetical protein
VVATRKSTSQVPSSELQITRPQDRSASAKGRPSQNPQPQKGLKTLRLDAVTAVLMRVFEQDGQSVTRKGPGMAMTLAAGALVPRKES